MDCTVIVSTMNGVGSKHGDLRMNKQLVKRIREIKAQMADAKARGNWPLYLDLNKSLGIMILNEK